MRRDAAWGYRRTDLRYSPLFQLRITMMERMSPSWPIAYLGWDKIERVRQSDISNSNSFFNL